ncbi:50S ribosomal protein L18Ae [Halogeometricum limi]|uniref:Large ribosomal subunit protein eL20 n=1 Tax=Halogeometricum limi TaxID=555875 RepID=A0A1I6FT36_9EURY|nr:50S ribosomal protein L18Ae [Halogeometricum limi]SFR33099.1 large subunit ribosomal protein LX [Halogeometricum limi]
MSQFTVSGQFQSRDGYSSFETSIEAPNENVARDHVLSNIGSQHGLKRTQIEISEVTAE